MRVRWHAALQLWVPALAITALLTLVLPSVVSGKSSPPPPGATDFYDTPDPLPAGRPGELIRSAAFHEYYLPVDVNTVRILYRSRTAAGSDVAASGVVLFPQGTPPAGAWPVIAWAPDWKGVARGCAPSLAKNLEHGPFLSMYVHLGYAVVAVDYAGLATRSRSAFGDRSSNALDVIYSISAARTAVPQLGRRWIVIGTGEGSAVAVRVNELEHTMHELDFMGTIAIHSLAELDEELMPQNAPSYRLPLLLTYGIQTEFPQFVPSEILSAAALPLYERMGRDCADVSGNTPSAAGMLKREWQRNGHWEEFLARNRLGLTPGAAPVLVIASDQDPLIRATTSVVDRLCERGDAVQFERYPESDPGRVIGDSARDQIAWIQSRFAGRPSSGNCYFKLRR
jgi:hypothetical protein